MITKLDLGPMDQGRPLTLEEFLEAEYAEGHRYELIEGRLIVSPTPDPPANILEHWILYSLFLYAKQRPDIVNAVFGKARVFIPDDSATAPEPDVAAYHAFPLDRPYEEIRWQDHSPILVVEVLDPDDPDKDLVRNVRLYHRVPSIREYWVIDPRPDPNRPTLLVHRRWGSRWRLRRVGYGQTYTTRLLPDFQLIVDPRR